MGKYSEYLKGLWRPMLGLKDPPGFNCLNHNEAPFSPDYLNFPKINNLNLYPEPYYLYKKILMSDYIPTREDAVNLFKKYNKSESLYKHALSVEGVMRYMARKNNEDEDKWGVIGLIHDLDYEMYPDQHCKKTEEILRENAWPEEYIRAVMSHGWGIVTDVEPVSKLPSLLEV